MCVEWRSLTVRLVVVFNRRIYKSALPWNYEKTLTWSNCAEDDFISKCFSTIELWNLIGINLVQCFLEAIKKWAMNLFKNRVGQFCINSFEFVILFVLFFSWIKSAMASHNFILQVSTCFAVSTTPCHL